jgi:hypothetical protein
MPDASLTPLLPPAPVRPAPEVPRSSGAEQARGPRIVPAFRFVPAPDPILADTGRLARDYAAAAGAGTGLGAGRG